MRRHVHLKAIVDRICTNHELALCELRREGVEILIKVCQLLNMPDSFVSGDKPLDPDIVESIALLLGDVLEAVKAEIAEPTQPLQWVNGGGE